MNTMSTFWSVGGEYFTVANLQKEKPFTVRSTGKFMVLTNIVFDQA